jgi:MOSC domain-containing protein YiiM
MPVLRSVNVGQPEEASWAGIGRTSIDKRPVSGAVRVEALGVDGDQVSDTVHHGGLDQAVYAYAREDMDRWAVILGHEIRDGQFAENLTTSGIDVNAAEVGERWRIGTTELEVSTVRIPCNDFKEWMGLSGYDNAHWVKRFTADGRPGPYLRVLQPGLIAAGDEISVVHRPGHGVTVATLFRALTTERHLLPELTGIEALPAKVKAKVEEYVATGMRTPTGSQPA